MTQVLLYVTNGKLDCKSSRFQVPLIPSKPKDSHPQKERAPTVSYDVLLGLFNEQPQPKSQCFDMFYGFHTGFFGGGGIF